MGQKNLQNCTECVKLAELETLLELSRLLMGSQTLEQKVSDSLKTLKNYLSLERCSIHLLNDDKKELNIFSSVDLTPKQKMLASYKVGEGATGLAASTKEPIVIENIHSDILFLNKTGARRIDDISYIATPMITGDNVVGVLGVSLTKKTALDFEECINFLTIVGSTLAQAIRLESSHKEEKKRLAEQNSYYKSEVLKASDFENIIGESAKMKEVFGILKKIAASKATVLIRGETGTGKELIAAALHQSSSRNDGPFVKLNCAAIAESLLESELFGHEKGAFTDAKEMRKGRFELADGGTLFLDEIGDISASLQVKLLRVLQEQEFERVGGSKTIKVDVRVAAATNRNLEEMVEKGEFREDLFYRLNVIPIVLPALRERGKDILMLANHFLYKFCKLHKKELEFTDDAYAVMLDYSWHGNIRELENTMERIVLLNDNGKIDQSVVATALPGMYIKDRFGANGGKKDGVVTKTELEDIERDAIISALRECAGIQAKAARKLGITVRQIGYKILKYGIEV
jgi:Nif-specific regulatory protein